MKALIVGLFLSIFFSGVLTAPAQSTETARIQINKEKKLARSKLTIKFLELVEDSRCPTDTQCIWAGNAKIKIQIRKNGRDAKTVELNTNLDAQSTTVAGYKIELTGLTPQPRSNIRINRNGYVATFRVTRV